MSGIAFMVDERGEKNPGVMDLLRHGRVWEDFYDTLQAESRAHEPRENLESVKRRFKFKRRSND
jgi:hypothetical protein